MLPNFVSLKHCSSFDDGMFVFCDMCAPFEAILIMFRVDSGVTVIMVGYPQMAYELEIAIEPWKKLVVHEVIEYGFEDLLRILLSQSRAAGGGIASMNWCNGLVFQHVTFPDTESVIQEKMKGVIHYSSVVFARKEKFERQIVKENGTLNLIDVSANQIFYQLADALKSPQVKRS